MEDARDAQIPVTTPAGSQTFAVMVGNCKNLWTHLVEACRVSPALLASSDPVDEYCERAIKAAASVEQ